MNEYTVGGQVWTSVKRTMHNEFSIDELPNIYSKVSNKRTVFDNRTGGDIILQKV